MKDITLLTVWHLTRPANAPNRNTATHNKRLKEMEVCFVRQGSAKLLHLPSE